MSQNQKLIIELLKIDMKENEETFFGAIGNFMEDIQNGRLTNEISRAYLSLDESEELELLAELAKG